MGKIVFNDKQPHWQNTKMSAVKEEFTAGIAFQPVLEALDMVSR